MPPQQRTYESIAARLRPPADDCALAGAGDLAGLQAMVAQGRGLGAATAAIAAEKGHLPVLKWLHARGVNIRCLNDLPLRLAARHGHLPVVQWLHAQGASLVAEKNLALRFAASNGHLNVVQWLHAHGVDIRWDNDIALRLAARHGHVPMLEWLHTQGADIGASSYHALRWAIEENRLPAVEWMHAKGVNMRMNDDFPVIYAAGWGHFSMLKWLHIQGADIRANNDEALRNTAMNGHLDIVKWLHEQGADIRVVDDFVVRNAAMKGRLPVLQWLDAQGVSIPDEIKPRLLSYNQWQARHGRCPQDLDRFSPFLFRGPAFDDVVGMLAHEGNEDITANFLAYNAAGLFGTTDRVLAYLDKWIEPGRQPLHDIIQHIKLPQDARFNVAAWADACLRYGPKMTRLVKFAGALPEPLKDDRGQWSYILTRAEIARNAYPRAAENHDLAVMCFSHDWDDDSFEKALKHIGAYAKKYGAPDARKPGGRIPEIAIDGAVFDKPGHRFYKLPDGDPRGLLLGEFTNCCQHIAGHGKDCAKHGFRSEQSGFYVVTDKKTDEIIAQSWAWRGTKDELVLDSLESLPGHMTTPQWRSLCDQFAAAARADKTAAVTAVHIGTGGATPDDMGYARAKPATPHGYDGYRDSKKQYAVTAP